MLRRLKNTPGTETRPAKVLIKTFAVAALLLACLLPTGAYAGVGISGSHAASGGPTGEIDWIAPMTQFRVPPVISQRTLIRRGLRLELRTSESVVATVFLHIPNAISVSGEPGSQGPLARRRVRIKKGKHRIRIRLSKSKRKLIKNRKKLLVSFQAEDRNGNRAAPLIKYIKIKKSKRA